MALQVLYALDANPEIEPSRAFAEHLERFIPDTAVAAAMDRAFAEDLVRGVGERRPELDEMLAQLSRNWRVDRMARVDRSLLRMALYELKYREDVPPAVIINEAVELAKRYAAEETPAFVNGLLDAALRTLGFRKAPG